MILIDSITDYVKDCKPVTDKHLDYFTFNGEEYFANPLNFAFKKGENIGFAEYKSPGTYWVHYCFDTAKGREAIELTKQMLETLFFLAPAKVAVGLIEVGNKKAIWTARQVGFKYLDTVDTPNGMCQMLCWMKNNKD